MLILGRDLQYNLVCVCVSPMRTLSVWCTTDLDMGGGVPGIWCLVQGVYVIYSDMY